MAPRFAPATAATVPLYLIAQDQLQDWLADQPETLQTWVTQNGFTGAYGQALLVPGLLARGPEGADPAVTVALAGYGTETLRARKRFTLAAAAEKLPAGSYQLIHGSGKTAFLSPDQLAAECLGWLLAQYRFTRYKAAAEMEAELVAPEGLDASAIENLAAAEFLTRDLINTPAADMGPAQLEEAVEALAAEFDASVGVIAGDDLLEANLPLIHSVGRAAEQAPRLIDLRWGSSGPSLTLVGKGVCFDTGGLNLKPGASMGLMKKDMGGAANVLGLARMIMSAGIKLQLRVLIPAVENSVAGNAFRPGDVLTSRSGLTVEINNTDAEGRLVLADALTLAEEGTPDLIISMATLTGAARVAVGPDLAPFYTDQDNDAGALAATAAPQADPVWRMPFHTPYESMIEPAIADLDNAPSGGFAGSITAALFLRRFAADSRYMHFDIYGWMPSAAPGRPKGGIGQGGRALFAALPALLDL
ncbi:leucyl aminopeptidase family protein [Pseudophaeobacter flagellatus]|uniref:leucyl aminopeptidase family protein n=1 Tax=Pseudophaeobacter flagellatus TaxID=2899119 RepID=UPI001E3153A8|nr:leucyl aminopeptidase family protein [Pseudophaeobacter flagellatus]MCD9149320.1 leucyl aminopeptidase family protein [Pseudophaeobacter flagellatus]